MHKTTKSIVILGASFNTGNLGVSALGVSTLEIIIKKWPCSNVCILGNVREPRKDTLEIYDSTATIHSYPVRFSPNIFNRNHFIWIYFALLLTKALPFLKPLLTICDCSVQKILKADMFFDVTAGDSFSDIYGMKRMKRLYFEKVLCQMTGKPYIMLPQTYGPFKCLAAKNIATKILSKANNILSRDKEGLETIKNLIGDNSKSSLCPDLAFTLEPLPCELPNKMDNTSSYVGLNISGLLYNGGYSGKNEFELSCNYKQMLLEIIEYFTSISNIKILLVPHVVPDNFEVENDLTACRKLKFELPENVSEKVIIAELEDSECFYNQSEIKYLIGKCGFFLGSRMHSTIAAISQCVPTIGLAYSKKFTGVYETAGIQDCVADLRSLNNEEILSVIINKYNEKDNIKSLLKHNIPELKNKVNSIFNDL